MSSHNGHSPNGVLGRTVLTTGQVARIVGVAPRTVTKWCADGRLKSYRIPGSLDRRIKREALEEFFRVNDLPFVVPESGVLLVGHSRPPTGWAGITVAADTLAAGVALASWVPALIVVDAGAMGPLPAATLAGSLKGGGRWDRTRLVCVLPDDTCRAASLAVELAGYDEVLRGEDGMRAARAMADGVTGGR